MTQIDDIIITEGGYVNDPNDSGGPTNMGITQETLSRHLGRRATIREVKNISYQTVYDIYESKYLIKPHIDKLPQPLQKQVLDWGINSGPSRSIRGLQRVLKYSGETIAVDGQLGPQTIKILHRHNIKEVNNKLVDRRIAFYERLVRARPKNQKFLRGWLIRAKKFYAR
jgi:lysozyme family protein